MSLRHRLNRSLKKFETDFATYNRIEVSRSALLHNINLFKQISSQQLIPVLKSNAYGHGLEIVAEALKAEKFPYVAVDGYFEALRIREVSKQPVLIMGAIKPPNFAAMRYNNFAFVVHDKETLKALAETGKRVNIHLEINTGMNRHGIRPAELKTFLKLTKRYPRLKLEGIMSHLADSDGNNQKTVDDAVNLFDNTVRAVHAAGYKPTLFHVAQTAGSLKAKSEFANAIRLGIGLYGINPFSSGHVLYKRLKDLRPALKLVSTITKVHKLKKGEKVSYNYTYAAPKNMRVGVLPLGYYEGVNRALSNSGAVKYGKKFLPIVGRVCMNHTMINLEGSMADVGDEVTVYSDSPGDKNALDAISKKSGLFNYNLLTNLSADVRRQGTK